MNEQNPVSPETTIAELQSRVSELQNLLEVASQGMQSWHDRFNRMQSKVQDWFDDGTIEEGDTVSDWLIDQFDIETTEDYSVTVTVTYQGNVTAPKGIELTDLEIMTDFPWDVTVAYKGNMLESDLDYQETDLSGY